MTFTGAYQGPDGVGIVGAALALDQRAPTAGELATMTTAASGKYTVQYTFPTAGKYRVYVTSLADGALSTEVTVTVAAPQVPTKLTVAEAKSAVQFPGTDTVDGKLTDQSGLAIPNFTVYLAEQSAPGGAFAAVLSQETATDGSYSFALTFDAAGTFSYQVWTDASGTGLASKTVTIAAVAFIAINAALTVVDSVTSDPIEGATVTIQRGSNTPRVKTTGVKGMVSFNSLPEPSVWSVAVAMTGYTTYTGSLTFDGSADTFAEQVQLVAA